MKCGDPCVGVSGRCVCPVKQPKTWNMAQLDCVNRNSRLLTVGSFMEAFSLLSRFKKLKGVCVCECIYIYKCVSVCVCVCKCVRVCV